MRQLLPFALLLAVTACSNQGSYEAIQGAKRQECETLPDSQRATCINSHSQAYRDYERSIRELQEDED